MIKSIKYFLFIISLLLSYHSQAATGINWGDEGTQVAISKISTIIEDRSFRDADFSSVGKDVKSLVRLSLEQKDGWRTFPLIGRNPIIFSIVSKLFLEGWDYFEKNLEKAAELAVIGYILETASSADPAIAYAIIGDTTKVRILSTESSDTEIEAAIKAVHRKLVLESEEETGE
jgi:hypothetical protein